MLRENHGDYVALPSGLCHGGALAAIASIYNVGPGPYIGLAASNLTKST